MMDRANAFRQHFDLDQERKYKELNLYVSQQARSLVKGKYASQLV